MKKFNINCVSLFFFANTLLASNATHTGKILEKMDAGIYTYVKFETQNETYWVAIPKTELAVGETLTVKESTWMKNFESKTLNKTFDKVMFADLENGKKAIHGVDNVHGIHGQKMNNEELKPDFKNNITTSNETPIKVTISELYEKKDSFKNKNVQIEGEIVQISTKVQGNSWVKISDGKEAVIVRSNNEDEKFKRKDKVSIITTINTDVDYGFGFKYQIIGVNAQISPIK